MSPMQQAQSPDELFDVVDADDQVIGQATRAEVHARKLFHRAVHILVFDSQNRLYLQKRSLLKDTCAGLYSTSCAGHVDAGETYDQAAVRELGEELGITLPPGQSPEFLFKSPPAEETGWEFIHVYQLQWDGPITPDPLEIDGGWHGSAKELEIFLRRESTRFSPSFLHVWQRYHHETEPPAAKTPAPNTATRKVRVIPWWKYLLSFPLALLIRLWHASLRFSIREDSPLSLAEFQTLPGGRIFVFWHNRIFVASELKRRFSKKIPMNGLVSASRDGSWLSAFFHMLGIGAVRGSSSWRGGPAMLELTRLLANGEDIAITPDGPRGPCYTMKSGPGLIAQKTQTPVLLVHSRFFHAKRLASWDGFYLPLPFSRIEFSLELIPTDHPAQQLPIPEFTAFLRKKMLERTDDNGIPWHPKNPKGNHKA